MEAVLMKRCMSVEVVHEFHPKRASNTKTWSLGHHLPFAAHLYIMAIMENRLTRMCECKRVAV